MSGIMKKAILILLAAALLVPCLTGCSGGELKKVRERWTPREYVQNCMLYGEEKD